MPSVSLCRYHSCKLCSHRQICDKSAIGRHVKDVHGLGLQEYEKVERAEVSGRPLTELEKVAKLKQEISPLIPPAKTAR